MSGQSVELSDVIKQLRQELKEAVSAGDGQDLRFELGPVELELTVAIEKAASTGAKVRFWVVDANMDGKVAAISTQRIHLTLEPRQITASGQQRVMVTGATVPGER
ncbi:trypco2 family protein [Streptomyces sp. NPDC054783]